MQACPCGSGQTLASCCGLLHAGQAAPTAESLMRSRYSAYVLGLNEYLIRTWHPDTRPNEWVCADSQWLGLHIIQTKFGEKEDDQGLVEFTACYQQASKTVCMHEISQFKRIHALWFYYHGECRTHDIGRNSPCPCGSGLKFKRCCQKIGSS
ncbi:MAG: YchJ family metal-binding protein [Mariprofundaceae bacterium]